MSGTWAAGPGCSTLAPTALACKAVGSVVGGVASHVAGATASAGLDAVSHWVVAGAVWLLRRIGGVLGAASEVHLGAPWFVAHERVMVDLGALVILPMLLVALIQAIIRQDPGIALRAALVHLPLALLLTAVAVQLVQLGTRITDQLCASVVAGSGGSLQRTLDQLAHSFAQASTSGAGGVASFVVFLVGCLVVLGSLALWLELLIRGAAIYVAVLFLPLALASLVWPAVSHWARRLAELLAALVLSKFAVVAILSMAAGAVASGVRGSSGIDTALSGAALLILASLCPFVLLRLLPMAEGALVLEGARQRLQAAATAVPRSTARLALRAASGMPLPGSFAGTGASSSYPAGGSSPGEDSSFDQPSGGSPPGDVPRPANGAEGAVPMWRGEPASEEAYARVAGAPGSPDPGPPGPGGSGGTPNPPGAAATGAPLGASGSAALRLGGPPVWGRHLAGDGQGRQVDPAPLGSAGSEPDEQPGRATSQESRRAPDHVIDHDALGPVIRSIGARRRGLEDTWPDEAEPGEQGRWDPGVQPR